MLNFPPFQVLPSLVSPQLLQITFLHVLHSHALTHPSDLNSIQFLSYPCLLHLRQFLFIHLFKLLGLCLHFVTCLFLPFFIIELLALHHAFESKHTLIPDNFHLFLTTTVECNQCKIKGIKEKQKTEYLIIKPMGDVLFICHNLHTPNFLFVFFISVFILYVLFFCRLCTTSPPLLIY